MNGENVEKRNLDSIFSGIEKNREDREKLKWTGDFQEYLDMVIENPDIARTAQATVYNTIKQPDFFTKGKNALYGSDDAIENLVKTMKHGAERSESAKRIILLLGPPGSGKSTLVNGTKRGIEEFSKTDEGAVYAINSCQMNEDPLHLIPEEMRDDFEAKYGVRIEGDLCPDCERLYGDEPIDPETGDRISLKDVKVKRVVFSENRRVGIGTFKPSDPKSQDIQELTGGVNLKGLEEHGITSDSRAFSFDGDINVANRGLMEFVEILKSDPRFLYTLLDLSQDRVIKAGKFANISVDEVIFAHTNYSEYTKFMSDSKNEALRDRFTVIEVRYPLKVSDEVKTYEKLIGQTDKIRKAETHVSPHALEMASMFSVMSRLKGDAPVRLQKMLAYDNSIENSEVEEMMEQGKEDGEGTFGVSPRFVIDAISNAIDDQECLTPIDVQRSILKQMDVSPYIRSRDEKDRKRIREGADLAMQVYNMRAKEVVHEAFTHAFRENAQTQCDNYIDNVVAFCNREKYVDEDGNEWDPDEKLMRSIEENMEPAVAEASKREHRQNLANRLASSLRSGKTYDFMANNPGLQKAVQKKMYAENKDSLRLAISSGNLNEEQQARRSDLEDKLISEYGYCEHCVGRVIKDANNAIRTNS